MGCFRHGSGGGVALWAVALVLALAVVGCVRLVAPLGGDAGPGDSAGVGDGDAGGVVPGWDLATFSAALRTTGEARVDFMVSVGDDPGLQPQGDWLSESEVRALGKRDGRYLSLAARFVSPDGLAAASLGRVAVEGTNGRAEWLVAGRPSRISDLPAGLVFRNGALTLEPALLTGEPAAPLLQDDFEDGVVDDVLWESRLSRSVQLTEAGGELEFVATSGGDGAQSELVLNLALRGDFDLRLDHATRAWPTSGGDPAHNADLRLRTESFECRLRRGAAANGNKARWMRTDDWVPLGSVVDEGGPAFIRLERVGDQVAASMLMGDQGQSLGDCALGSEDAVLIIGLIPGFSTGVGRPIEVAVDEFEVASGDGIVGYDQTSPQVQFQTEDALLPRATISPASFPLPGPVAVTLGATPPARSLFYTTDDTDPASSPSRQRYEEPFEVASSAQVRAVAVTDDGQVGWTAAERYFVGRPLAHAPLDGDEGAVIETIHGWNGIDHGTERGVVGMQGKAVFLEGNRDSILEFPDSSGFGSSAYQVRSGAVSLWFKPTQVEGEETLVSKDSMSYDTGGHLAVWLRAGELMVRLQSLSAGYFVKTLAVPLTPNRWHRVAVLFGRPSLTIMLWDHNGVLLGSWSEEFYGGLGEQLGQPGNREPLVLGASLAGSGDGVVTSLGAFFSGAIDEFVFLSLE